jgi:hypothetical protein
MRSPFFSSLGGPLGSSFLGHSLGLSVMGMLILASTPGVAAPVSQVIPQSGTIVQSSGFGSSGSNASGLNLAQLDLLDLPQFYSVPRLIYTGTNRDQVRAHRPIYYFTLLFPPSEGAALGTVDLIQIEGLPIPLLPEETIVFGGTRQEPGDRLPVTVTLLSGEAEPIGTSQSQESHRRKNQRGVRLQFNDPVVPGQTLTLAVRARFNPYQDGIYQYALVAYPQENLRDGYTLGIGRLNFYKQMRFRF